MDELSVGLVAGKENVEAFIVEATPFGRLRPGDRRLVEDNDGPGLVRSLDGPLRASTDLVGDAWLGCLANAAAKLVFGLPATQLVVGIAVDGEVRDGGQTVMPAGLFSAIEDAPARLLREFKGRGIEVKGPPVFVDHAVAWARGESTSALGSLAEGVRGLLLVWGRHVRWVAVAADGLTEQLNADLGENSLGFDGLDVAYARQRGTDLPSPILSSARHGDPVACELLRKAAETLAQGAVVRLGDDRRLVLSGILGRAALDERLRAHLREPFEDLLDGPGNQANTREVEDSDGSAVHVSREEAAPAIGAVALARAADQGRHTDSGGTRGEPSGESTP